MIGKIKNQEEKEKKRKRNQLLLGGGLVFLLLLSTAGFAIMNNDENTQQGTGALGGETLTDKGIEFALSQPYWVANLNGQQFIAQNLPSEIETINVEGTYNLQDYSGRVLYFVGNQDGATEILNNLAPYALRYQEACHESIEECGENLPTKTCNDNLFIFIQGNEEKVYKEQNCVYLQGDPIKTADAFIYKTYGIN